jgi:hypothetical protein
MIGAGTKSQVEWGSGSWIFLDIGFAKGGNKTCGLLFGDDDPKCVEFGECREQIVKQIRNSTNVVNLVIEAPLSICFDSKRNPKGRFIEKEGGETRYWYVGLGCAVMVAAMYLIRDIHEDGALNTVRLFEGFVSYKNRSRRSTHQRDVSLLRDVVRNPSASLGTIFSPEQLKTDPTTDVLCSAFRVSGLDCGVPAVIRPRQWKF